MMLEHTRIQTTVLVSTLNLNAQNCYQIIN
jgi:hypothetical protein